MKHLLFFLLSVFFIQQAGAQNAISNVEVNPKIYDFYPESKVSIILKEEPKTILYWNAILESGFDISDAPTSKGKETASFSEIIIEDLNNVNILKMGIFPNKAFQYFRIKNTNKLLVVKPEALIKKQMSTKK